MELITLVVYISVYIGLVSTSFYILTYLDSQKRKTELFTEKELPTVSIIIPAYNEEKTIKKTIQSILESNYPSEFEVIVIDDGSKDNTLKFAKQIKDKRIKVFTKPNGGKGSALNMGISKAKGEIIFTMDADTYVDKNSMKNMTPYFKNPEIMAVTPAMVTHNPQSLLQRIQNTEYLLGLFLRKVFAALNALYVTPGAFSCYRAEFFKKYGGFDEHNITEDLEIGLRIHLNGYKIENSPEAPAYTVTPTRFKELTKQRRRWYFGLMKNIFGKYKVLLTPKYGDMGIIVMPVAWISILLAVFMVVYFFIDILTRITDKILFLPELNYDISGFLNINLYIIERTIFFLLTNPSFIFILFFVILLGFFLYYASHKIGRLTGIIINLPLYFIAFAILFGFWWVVSIFYYIFYSEVSWK